MHPCANIIGPMDVASHHLAMHCSNRSSRGRCATARVACALALSLWLPMMAHGAPDAAARYTPIDGGWRIEIGSKEPSGPAAATSRMGVVAGNPRLHRRPLYPPADRSMVWSPGELVKLRRCAFRPLVLAYNEPRFLFDFHSAGGLLGHLHLGLAIGNTGKWFHQWSRLSVSYVDGRMEYTLRDRGFPGVVVHLAALPLAKSVGLVVKVDIEAAPKNAQFIWAYGGASAFFTNYAMNAPEFTFAPAQCAKDHVRLGAHSFSLYRHFDDRDAVMKQVFAAARYLPHWRAEIVGGSSWDKPVGFGSADRFAVGPRRLATTAVWSAAGSVQDGCVAVQRVAVAGGSAHGYVGVGMGGAMHAAVRDLAAAWRAGRARNEAIAARVVTQTPDRYLDAAVRMMAFATNGTWGDLAILHGGWSWRFAYLGWRGWYGSTCYGWEDRVRRSIRNHTQLGLVRQGLDHGALGSLLEYSPGVFYNMNEVFLDQVRHYFDYTNDTKLMRAIFPVLRGVVAWENRRLQPAGKFLYENSLNTWISDSHWYIGGQCTQASAYMLRAHAFLADLAGRLGEDATPFKQRANRIRSAMQKRLWMPEKGCFAEYLDTRGARLLHPEPELPTLYHAAEFGAADPRQVALMLRWAHRHLRQEGTPGGGTLFWSSNWFPNHGRSYTHSTYEMAYAEELNFALTHYLAGRSDDAYALIRATLCGIFNGPTPGGLSCHCFTDGRQRANDEFADAISMWGRTVVEGLFGIAPKRPDGVVDLTPQLPDKWPGASIATPHFSYRLRRQDGRIVITWKSPVTVAVRLHLPVRTAGVDRVTVDGQPVQATVARGFAGVNWAHVRTPRGKKGTIRVDWTPAAAPASRLRTPVRTHGQPPPTWQAPDPGGHHREKWQLVDLGSVFNTSVTAVLQRVAAAAQPPALPASRVGFDYWKQHLRQRQGSRNQPIRDAAWRAQVGPDGVAWTVDGIPFKTSKQGPNIAVITLAGGFPRRTTFPVGTGGKTLYLMLSGMTFPVQSHVVNIRVALRYADGVESKTNLVNPWTIGDCWSTWCGRFHDTRANGFVNLGGRFGPKGSAEVADLTRPIAVDTEAHLVAFPLRQTVPLVTVAVEAVANDVIFGVMGATVER